MYYKLRQACFINWGSIVLLQIRANGATNWGSFIITNWGKWCYKLEQVLQIRAIVITRQGSYYKLGHNALQIGAGITNQGNYYKLGHSTPQHTKKLLHVSFGMGFTTMLWTTYKNVRLVLLRDFHLICIFFDAIRSELLTSTIQSDIVRIWAHIKLSPNLTKKQKHCIAEAISFNLNFFSYTHTSYKSLNSPMNQNRGILNFLMEVLIHR